MTTKLQRRRSVWTTIGGIVSIAALVWIFWRIDFDDLISVFKRSHVPLVIAIAALNFIVWALKSWRWQVVISAACRVPYKAVLLATLIGVMVNSVLPARAGELARVILLGRRTKVSNATLLASLGLDRLFEGVAMLGLVSALPLVTTAPPWFRSAAFVLTAAIVGLLIVSALLTRQTQPHWIEKFPLPTRVKLWLTTRIHSLGAGFAAVRRPRYAFATLGIATITWGVQTLMVWMCFLALDIKLSLIAALLVLISVNIAVIAPAAPGNLGTFELAVVAMLTFLGQTREVALAVALLYHMAQLIPTVIVGAVLLPLSGMGLSRIREETAP